ncbi:Gfo/Idh/MocA family oxidoreductase [Roseivirga pacifica]|uniref:Gfo/Idh/MocA family oxidoreductase n=1 Tax=Roseivirga pacifica TaxID=1267423 RepID=UPI00227BB907|nr:Gfo/Idh/MocA family oxidoreductase [Roseivirga pacifica]
MAQKLKLGVIGMSEGNGHPYSWSAIFNGYDEKEMSHCPFPIIPQYLGEQKFPEDFLNEHAEVTHIWTQDKRVSEQIAKAALIHHVCAELEDMIGEVDGVLLGRDDAENHLKFARPFIEAGIPIYIDKPFALSMKSAEELWALSNNNDQIFTCSALQFAREFQTDKLNLELLGEVRCIWATVPKSWSKYAVHIIEPVMNLFPDRGKLKDVKRLALNSDQVNGVQVEWSSGIQAQFQTTGHLPSPLIVRILGTKGYQELKFEDAFFAFRFALKRFVDIIKGQKNNIPRSWTKEMVKILEAGFHA